MDWSAAGAPLIAARAVHFAATAMTVGSIIFGVFIAKPVLRHHIAAAISFRRRTRPTIWASLVLAAISGAFWLLLEAASMSGMPLEKAVTADVLSTVVGETQFGEVTTIRAGFVICLAACLVYDRAVTTQWLGLAAAVGFACSLAWTGHAGSTIGVEGYLHLAADALHVVAAAAWIGGLASLIAFLTTTQIHDDTSLARDAVGGFSTLGVVSVGVVLLTGVVNAAILVGSLHALVATEYGRVLTLKIGSFAAMLAYAAINRLRLTPQLAFIGQEQSSVALRRLIRNSAIETALGLGILVMVGVLGTLHPAIHLVEPESSW
ncbi:putative copper resistance protein D [Bradyrhizobium sp. Ghvi]|uniref:copper homeostasis membrane protein CopD n=1 Tax=Bradyrhizobium sp. Ghvi TaxID=1855319 RepID=UPI0008E6D1C9|nr:copper homeostasis membrane protein CopD [Bradyrhizobium sp. Ghvi]SFO53526.1 putative copper resistance protein D [Bradyrhizobium sp. Ghvi]